MTDNSMSPLVASAGRVLGLAQPFGSQKPRVGAASSKPAAAVHEGLEAHEELRCGSQSEATHTAFRTKKEGCRPGELP